MSLNVLLAYACKAGLLGPQVAQCSSASASRLPRGSICNVCLISVIYSAFRLLLLYHFHSQKVRRRRNATTKADMFGAKPEILRTSLAATKRGERWRETREDEGSYV